MASKASQRLLNAIHDYIVAAVHPRPWAFQKTIDELHKTLNNVKDGRLIEIKTEGLGQKVWDGILEMIVYEWDRGASQVIEVDCEVAELCLSLDLITITGV